MDADRTFEDFLSDPYAAFAVDLARRAGERLMALFAGAAADKEIRLKGPANLVTRADREVEAFLLQAVTARFPDHGYLGEEGARRPGGEFRWVADPLDGTTNFAHRVPVFTVSLALQRRDEIVLGVVCDPVLRELFVAGRGRGAWVLQDGAVPRRLEVSVTARLEDALLATGFSGTKVRPEHLRPLGRFLQVVHGVRNTGSAALHLAYVAAGRLDAFWEAGLNLWDVAAGLLLVEEAGGRVSDIHGGPLRSWDVLASNGHLHEAVVAVLNAP